MELIQTFCLSLISQYDDMKVCASVMRIYENSILRVHGLLTRRRTIVLHVSVN